MSEREWYDDVNTKAVFWTGFYAILIIIVLVLGVQAAYFAYNHSELINKEHEPAASNKILAEQTKDLNEYKRIKVGDTSRIAIPIDKAMDLVAKELVNKPEG